MGICDPDAPFPTSPNTGMASAFVERPAEQQDSLWGQSGAGGFWSNTYDLGCDPRDVVSSTQAVLDTATANLLTDIGVASTAAADYIDRKSWEPGWVTDFLGQVAGLMADAINANIVLPFALIGAVIASLGLVLRARHGAISAVATGVGWTMLVLLVSGFVLTAPTRLGEATQSGTGWAVGLLNGGKNPATSQTVRTVDAVHYQGWLRRTFGDPDSLVAREHGKALFNAQRLTWTEAQATDEAKQKIIDRKAEDFTETAEAIKEADPEAYEHLRGTVGGRQNAAALELVYALAANAFRIMAALLRVICVIGAVILGLVWVAVAPWLLTGKGMTLGYTLLNNTFRSVAYAMAASLGSWGFSVWSQVGMAPSLPMGWSLVLLLLGVFVFWSLIRPDRKILSMVSFGSVNGYGRAARWAVDKAVSYAGVRHAIDVEMPDRDPEPVAFVETETRAPSAYRDYVASGRIVDDPRQAPEPPVEIASPNVIPGEVIYQRDEHPSPEPPPAGARPAELEVYQR